MILKFVLLFAIAFAQNAESSKKNLKLTEIPI